ncbi:MAG: exopolysaccharide biosynthesis polyprenyl glycosylphosphotransferase, partial [Microscillaceae bacterium]|nr:exopolysaccharide biosynthesis polyprenyl glycosylphosphotransferase [Microscillaceae bacterium]
MKQNDKVTATETLLPSSAFETLADFLRQFFVQLVKIFTPIKARRVFIVGEGPQAEKLMRFFQRRQVGYVLQGHCSPHSLQLKGGDLLDYLCQCWQQQVPDEIYCTLSPQSHTETIQALSTFADRNFIYFRMAKPEITPALPTPPPAFYYDNVPIVTLRREPLASRANQVLKRAFDIVFSLVVLAILIPFVFPIIALAIKLESRGPVFFVQMRPGFKNKLFPCFKFRSMAVNGETERQATKNDMRITKVGAFLRKTSLDELPQFANVLLGHMSVVGPRPNMQKQLEYYSTVIDNYAFRHFTLPGITGWAQVNGYRGETQTVEAMAQRVDLDIEYMQKWSLWTSHQNHL